MEALTDILAGSEQRIRADHDPAQELGENSPAIPLNRPPKTEASEGVLFHSLYAQVGAPRPYVRREVRVLATKKAAKKKKK